MPTKNCTELIETIWAFVQKEEETIPEEMQTPKKDIEEAVYEIEALPGLPELRISGETGNNFSDFYVNYHDGGETAGKQRGNYYATLQAKDSKRTGIIPGIWL